MKGAILFVCRNSLPLTKLAIKSALAQDIECSLLAVDNASSDGTNSWLRTKKFASAYYANQVSLSQCWNQGLKAFWGAGAKQVLVCNTDIELRSDYYRLLAEVGGPFVTGVGVNDPKQVGRAGDRAAADLLKTVRPHPDFSAFLINKSVTDSVGYFDESYFPAFYEDNKMHVLMKKAGVPAICVDLPFLHHGSSTLKQADPGEAARIRSGADRNKEKFRKEFGFVPGTKEYEDFFK